MVEDVVAEQNRVGLSIGSYTETTNDHVIRDSVFRENTGAGLELDYPAQGVAIERCSITGNGVGVTADCFTVERPHQNHIVDCDDLGEHRRRHLSSRTAPSR